MVAAHQSGESKGRLKRKALQTDLIYQVVGSMEALPALAVTHRRIRANGRIIIEINWLSCHVTDHATNIAESVHYVIEGRPIADQRPKGDTTTIAALRAGDR